MQAPRARRFGKGGPPLQQGGRGQSFVMDAELGRGRGWGAGCEEAGCRGERALCAPSPEVRWKMCELAADGHGGAVRGRAAAAAPSFHPSGLARQGLGQESGKKGNAEPRPSASYRCTEFAPWGCAVQNLPGCFSMR